MSISFPGFTEHFGVFLLSQKQWNEISAGTSDSGWRRWSRSLSCLGEFVHQGRSDSEQAEVALDGVGCVTENIRDFGSKSVLC